MAENVPNVVFVIDSVDLDLDPLSSDPFKVSTVFISWKLKFKIIQIQKFDLFIVFQNALIWLKTQDSWKHVMNTYVD